MNKNPKVSVLTPIFNTKPEHLRAAIDSILSQTFSDFEFIILNDSPNNTLLDDIVNSYKDERIKYLKNDVNIGISASRNKLLSLANGKYIAIFDHDDISLPQRLELQSKYLDLNPSTGVVGCNYTTMHSKITTNSPNDNFSIKKEMVINGLCVVHSGSMIRKSVLLNNNIGWEEEYSPCEDYMLWARLIDKTIFHNLKEVLLVYRDWDDNTSSRQSLQMEDCTCRIKNYLLKEYPYYASLNSRKSKIYLFNFIPIKKERKGNKTKYLLFGKIPILKIIK